jgi:hypothetical protein
MLSRELRYTTNSEIVDYISSDAARRPEKWHLFPSACMFSRVRIVEGERFVILSTTNQENPIFQKEEIGSGTKTGYSLSCG